MVRRPAEGVIVRNKRGHRAKLRHPSFREPDGPTPIDASAAEVASKYATQRRFEKIASTLEDRDQPLTFETLYERMLEDIVRENHQRLYHGETTTDTATFRSEVGALTRRYLETRE